MNRIVILVSLLLASSLGLSASDETISLKTLKLLIKIARVKKEKSIPSEGGFDVVTYNSQARANKHLDFVMKDLKANSPQSEFTAVINNLKSFKNNSGFSFLLWSGFETRLMAMQVTKEIQEQQKSLTQEAENAFKAFEKLLKDPLNPKTSVFPFK